MVSPRSVENDPFFHSTLEESHIDGLPPEPILSFELVSTASRTSLALGHNSLVDGEGQLVRFSTPADFLEALVRANVDPFPLIVEICAVAGTFQIGEYKVRSTVHGPFRGWPRQVARW